MLVKLNLRRSNVQKCIIFCFTHKVEQARLAEGEGRYEVGAVAHGQLHESLPLSQDQPDFAALGVGLVQHLPGSAHDQDGRRPLGSTENELDRSRNCLLSFIYHSN